MKFVSATLFLLCLSLFLITCKNKPVETSPVETKITGRISDKTSNNPIAGAVVSTSPATSSVTTDGNGNYSIDNVKTGQYVVTASKDGYKPNSTTVSVKEGETSSADIQLEQLTPALALSATTLDFGIAQTSLSFTISNSTQYGTLQWSIVKNADWLSVNPTSGTVTSGTNSVTLTANRVGLAYGNYSTTLTITSNGGNKDIPVTLTVQNPNASQLTVSPLTLDFGATTTNLTFNIYNTGTGTLRWTASSLQAWITVSPTSDSTRTETDVVTVQVNRTTLTPGNYTGQVQIASNAGTQTVGVQISVQSPPTLSLSTTQLDFGSTLTNLTFNIYNSGTGTLNWSIASDHTWLTINPANDTNNASVNVYVNRSGISSGSYTGTLSIGSNGGTGSVNVTMAVSTSSNPSAVTLNAPTNITTSSIDLSWTQNNDSDFKQYEVHKSTSAGFTPSTSTLVQTITNKSTTSTTVTGLAQGTTYYFKIRVVNTGNLFSDSNERSAAIPALSNPTAVTLNAPTNITTSSVDLSWTQNNDSDFKQYEVHKSTNVGFTPSSSTLVQTITNKSTTSTTVSGLTQGTTYYFKIRVVNSANLFSDSNERNVSTPSASVSWRQVSLPLDFSINSVHYISDNNIWAGGYKTISGLSFPQIYQFDGSQWNEIQVQSQDSTGSIKGISFKNNAEGWACSTNRIYKFDGSWKVFSYLPSSTILTDATSGINDVWFWGEQAGLPVIYRWNSQILSKYVPGTILSSSINDFNLDNSGVAYAIDNSGYGYFFDGSGWIDLGNSGPGKTISGTSQENIWASDGKYLYRYDGVKWTRLNDIGGSGIYYYIINLRLLSANEGWAVASSPSRGIYNMYFFDGSSWRASTITVPGDLWHPSVCMYQFGNNLWGIFSSKLYRLK